MTHHSKGLVYKLLPCVVLTNTPYIVSSDMDVGSVEGRGLRNTSVIVSITGNS